MNGVNRSDTNWPIDDAAKYIEKSPKPLASLDILARVPPGGN